MKYCTSSLDSPWKEVHLFQCPSSHAMFQSSPRFASRFQPPPPPSALSVSTLRLLSPSRRFCASPPSPSSSVAIDGYGRRSRRDLNSLKSVDAAAGQFLVVVPRGSGRHLWRHVSWMAPVGGTWSVSGTITPGEDSTWLGWSEWDGALPFRLNVSALKCLAGSWKHFERSYRSKKVASWSRKYG